MRADLQVVPEVDHDHHLVVENLREAEALVALDLAHILDPTLGPHVAKQCTDLLFLIYSYFSTHGRFVIDALRHVF